METTAEVARLWRRVLRDPHLRNLPYKVETNQHGQIVLSPRKPRHSFAQTRISDLLRDHLTQPGARAVEFAVETTKGVKVPDVVWISEERLAGIPDDAESSPVMPELCVEVLSEDNTVAEIDEKRRLYFESGALEVWICATNGTMTFYDPSGEIPASTLAPSFPASV